MIQKRNNIFLTGAPSSGKTTVIRKVIASLPGPAKGFYTQESKQGDRRVGFMMHTLDGEQGWLAHQDITSDFHIRRYGVSIENIDTLAVPSIAPVKNAIIILDEIGKMECFSLKFRQAAIAALDSDNIVIGTITLGRDEFILSIKARNDMEIHEVTPENRNSLPELIRQKISTVIT